MIVYRRTVDEAVDLDTDVIQVGCNIHGSFLVQAEEHLDGKGCPICDYLDKKD